MKRRISPAIKAHLIRGAFYVLLLLAVCVVPFVLGQRTAGKRGIAAAIVGRISIGPAMQPIEVQTLVNGETKSVMPPLQHATGAATPTLVPGPDQILAIVSDMIQTGANNGNFVGIGVGTWGE